MSMQGIALLTLAVVLAQDTPQGRLIDLAGEFPTDLDTAFGITAQPGKEGEMVSVTIMGTAPAEAAEAFDKGVKLTADANGCLLAAEDGDVVVAISLEAATEAGEFVEVLRK